MALKPTNQILFEGLEPWEQELLESDISINNHEDGKKHGKEKQCGPEDDSSLPEFDAIYGNQLIDNYVKKNKLKECSIKGPCLNNQICFWNTREKE
ncbi:MAG: hypothetical protein FWE16_01735 [Firmicutes bacterium]|nr:hypothetical protein [Bacillota bacterium]